jgi:hypothetical protein
MIGDQKNGKEIDVEKMNNLYSKIKSLETTIQKKKMNSLIKSKRFKQRRKKK